jgi:hypothetical protein
VSWLVKCPAERFGCSMSASAHAKPTGSFFETLIGVGCSVLAFSPRYQAKAGERLPVRTGGGSPLGKSETQYDFLAAFGMGASFTMPSSKRQPTACQ